MLLALIMGRGQAGGEWVIRKDRRRLISFKIVPFDNVGLSLRLLFPISGGIDCSKYKRNVPEA